MQSFEKFSEPPSTQENGQNRVTQQNAVRFCDQLKEADPRGTRKGQESYVKAETLRPQGQVHSCIVEA